MNERGVYLGLWQEPYEPTNILCITDSATKAWNAIISHSNSLDCIDSFFVYYTKLNGMYPFNHKSIKPPSNLKEKLDAARAATIPPIPIVFETDEMITMPETVVHGLKRGRKQPKAPFRHRYIELPADPMMLRALKHIGYVDEERKQFIFTTKKRLNDERAGVCGLIPMLIEKRAKYEAAKNIADVY